MQGRSRPDRELLDAGEMAGHLVPAGSVFAFLALHRAELFPDSFIADLFDSRTGRPSLSADLVGSVLVLQQLYDLSDGQAADALKFDIRWKVACGRSLTQMSFDPSTLVYWRKRIVKSGRPDRVFDAVAQVIGQTGILAGRRKRCVDSTVFDDAVATMDTVTQLISAIRRVGRGVLCDQSGRTMNRAECPPIAAVISSITSCPAGVSSVRPMSAVPPRDARPTSIVAMLTWC